MKHRQIGIREDTSAPRSIFHERFSDPLNSVASILDNQRRDRWKNTVNRCERCIKIESKPTLNHRSPHQYRISSQQTVRKKLIESLIAVDRSVSALPRDPLPSSSCLRDTEHRASRARSSCWTTVYRRECPRERSRSVIRSFLSTVTQPGRSEARIGRSSDARRCRR